MPMLEKVMKKFFNNNLLIEMADINFKQFNYILQTIPVKLISFGNLEHCIKHMV